MVYIYIDSQGTQSTARQKDTSQRYEGKIYTIIIKFEYRVPIYFYIEICRQNLEI